MVTSSISSAEDVAYVNLSISCTRSPKCAYLSAEKAALSSRSAAHAVMTRREPCCAAAAEAASHHTVAYSGYLTWERRS